MDGWTIGWFSLILFLVAFICVRHHYCIYEKWQRNYAPTTCDLFSLVNYDASLEQVKEFEYHSNNLLGLTILNLPLLLCFSTHRCWVTQILRLKSSGMF